MAGRSVLCAGLFSSASTWTFNVTKRLLEVTYKLPALSVYSDALDDAAEQQLIASPKANVIIKSHSPESSLRSLASFGSTRIIVTVRHPLDAVASLMERFRLSFDEALVRVELSANNIAKLRSINGALVLKFESAFYDSRDTVECIAHHLGARTSKQQRLDIFNEHMPDVVKAKIANFCFDGSNPASEFDPATHWHPRHVGDMRVGKWMNILSEAQVHQVRDLTSVFRRAFSYQ